MPFQRRTSSLAILILVLAPLGAVTTARQDQDHSPPVVTIKGNVLCNRATDTKPWFWDPKDGDHTPVIYALEGTPAIAEQVRTIMESYPDRGLDVEDALPDSGPVHPASQVLHCSRPDRREDPQGRGGRLAIAGPDRNDLGEGRKEVDHRHPI